MSVNQTAPSDDEIMAGMTAGEREALLSLQNETGGEPGADGDDDQDDQGDGDDQDDAGNPDDDAGDAGDDGAATGGRDDGEPATAAEDDAGEPPAATVPTAPLFVAEAPAEADAKLAEIATKKDALDTQFDDGEITHKEFRTAMDALAKEERAIERQVDQANIAAQMKQQADHNEWVSTLNGFFAQHKDYTTNVRLHRALDVEVREIAASETGRLLTGAKILEQAHANLVEAGFVKVPAATEKPAAPGAKAKTVAAPALPNIGRLPAAAGTDTGEGRFAGLANLNGFELESAMAKMSEADRDAFMKSN